ncbi:hypothetical protein DFH07DRAFT_965651 [Mycena maculata]|uniref:Uncharacterized protein n=1 Tax=Mycena maculata TaxID=230809 RepID=A0AAD7IBY7_9AGAR|nr:hypothetical protein DFH07DRAFT_965651 [Mycena maculata]
MAVTSYPALLVEVTRLLRPRGLFLSGEWARSLVFHPAFAPRTLAMHVPALTSFYARPTPHPPAHRAAPRAHGCLRRDRAACVPHAAWRRLGRAFRAVFLRYVASVRLMLAEGGALSAATCDDMYARVECELRTVAGLVAVFHTVHARKI